MKICLVCEGISATEQDDCSACGMRLLRTDEVHFPVRRGEADGANPLIGTVIDDKYRVTNVLGKGGMGTVFRAVHQVSLVPVAIKTLHLRLAAQDSYRRSFLEEARKAGRVVHEHSARILDVGEDADGVVFIAQELVEGVTLDEWIHFGDGISPSVAVDVLHQISCALHAMHSVGLVHCDLSPHNIMVQLREGQPFVKVLDFGIAKAGPSTGGEGRSRLARLAPQGDGGIDSESGLRGWANPPYSAPEHLEGKDVDVRADIYSLGVIGYEILTRTFPVEGESGRQLAKATIEGRIQPLRATIEIPPRLSHLINGMLAMSLADRPTDASEIVQELESIRRPQLQLLSLMSVVMLTISAFAFVLVHLLAEEPLLRMQPCLLHWAESPESDQKIVELRSEDLVDLRFDYDGFDAGDFEVVAHHGSGGARTKAEGLVPMVTADGELTLSGDSPAYRGFLVAMAGLQDAVTLAFGVQGRPPMGYSQVLVDDEPPVIGFRRSDLVDRTLTAAESLILNIEDKGSIKTVQMVARYHEDGSSKDDSVELPPRKGQTVYRARDLLASTFPGVSAWSEVVLVVRVSDAAGNVSSKSISLPGVDLEVPGIRNVEGRRAAGIVLCGPKGARLKILLDRFESGLSLLVTQPRGGRQEIPLSAMGTEQLFVMEPFTSDARLPAEDGSYRFQIRDAAGNLSAVLDRKLRFRSASAESILRGGADQAAGSEVVELDDGIVVSGTPVQLAFTCNEVYRPSHARMISAAGIPMESGARLVDVSDGQGTIILEGLADGAYLLEITTEDRSAAIGPTESYPVRVLAGSVRLRLPVPPGSRFLRELIGSGLLVEAEGGVQQGARWSCVPDDFRLIQGTCWFGSPRNLVPSELQPVRDGDGLSLIGTLSLLQGENVLALELQDVFGRPIDILVGQERAPTEDVDGGDSVSRVAQFFFHDQPLQPPADVRVEFGQASRIPLDIKLPLRPGDGVKLQIGSLLRKADSIIPSPDGARVEFRVPFEALMSSILPETPTRESFAKLSLPKADCVLDTPGGRFDVTLQFQVTLSNLPRVHARGFLDPGRVVPDVLAEMAMVPVLSSADAYPDPVPLTVKDRDAFRPGEQIAVSNVGSFYLQEAEMTRAQYAGIIDAFQKLDAGARGDWQDLLHPMDPAGEDRLDKLLPLWLEGNEAAWRAKIAKGPDRPVTGISFYQAYTATRILGLLLSGDPELLRLPAGVELEIAALGSKVLGEQGIRLNGVTSGQREMSLAGHYAARNKIGDAEAWPLTALELRELGDVVHTEIGFDVIGLDFGVREWVIDLPFAGGQQMQVLLRQWLADHPTHLNRAGPIFDDSNLDPEVRLNAIVRGLALGETEHLVDVADGRLLKGAGKAPPTLPGVVRTQVLSRSGRGLLEGPHPLLQMVGFRVAGGEKMVRRVRGR